MRAPSESELQEVVRRVVKRTLGAGQPNTLSPTAPAPAPDPGFDTIELATSGGGRDSLPLSSRGQPAPAAAERDTPSTAQLSLDKLDKRPVAFGADHGGYALKESLKEEVVSLGYPVIDCGTSSGNPVDYPDYAYAVARLVSENQAWRGIIVDGAGIGSCIAANKVPGVRAALCYDHATAVNSREHNNANVLTLGAGLIGFALASQITRIWLTTEFGGGRHARRVEKIAAIERRFLKAES